MTALVCTRFRLNKAQRAVYNLPTLRVCLFYCIRFAQIFVPLSILNILTMYFTGIIIAVCTFLTIGIWHPIVIKTEYYWGTRAWSVFLLIGLAAIAAALFIENTIISAVVGVFGASALWGIGELFEQKKRVERGWFPKNPKRER